MINENNINAFLIAVGAVLSINMGIYVLGFEMPFGVALLMNVFIYLAIAGAFKFHYKMEEKRIYDYTTAIALCIAASNLIILFNAVPQAVSTTLIVSTFAVALLFVRTIVWSGLRMFNGVPPRAVEM